MIIVDRLMFGEDLTLGHKSLLTATQRARWDAAVLEELAAPCAMELAAVVDALGSLIDFEWRFADPLATLIIQSCTAYASQSRRQWRAGLCARAPTARRHGTCGIYTATLAGSRRSYSLRTTE